MQMRALEKKKKNQTTSTKQMNCSSDANMHRIHRWAPLDKKQRRAGGHRETEAPQLVQGAGLVGVSEGLTHYFPPGLTSRPEFHLPFLVKPESHYVAQPGLIHSSCLGL